MNIPGWLRSSCLHVGRNSFPKFSCQGLLGASGATPSDADESRDR
jgi:hypothetical protein